MLRAIVATRSGQIYPEVQPKDNLLVSYDGRIVFGANDEPRASMVIDRQGVHVPVLTATTLRLPRTLQVGRHSIIEADDDGVRLQHDHKVFLNIRNGDLRVIRQCIFEEHVTFLSPIALDGNALANMNIDTRNLNVSDYIRTGELFVERDARIGGALTAEGDVDIHGELRVATNLTVHNDAAVVGQLSIGVKGLIVDGLLEAAQFICSGPAKFLGPVYAETGISTGGDINISGTLFAATLRSPIVETDDLRADKAKVTVLEIADILITLNAVADTVITNSFQIPDALDVTTDILICKVPARFESTVEVIGLVTALGGVTCSTAVQADDLNVTGDLLVTGELLLPPGSTLECESELILTAPVARADGDLEVSGSIMCAERLSANIIVADELAATQAILSSIEAGEATVLDVTCDTSLSRLVQVSDLFHVTDAVISGTLLVRGLITASDINVESLNASDTVIVKGDITSSKIEVVDAQFEKLNANTIQTDALTTTTLDANNANIETATLTAVRVTSGMTCDNVTADDVLAKSQLRTESLILANTASVSGFIETPELIANNAIIGADTLIVTKSADLNTVRCVAATVDTIDTITSRSSAVFVSGEIKCKEVHAVKCIIDGSMTASELIMPGPGIFSVGLLESDSISAETIECGSLQVSGSTSLAACDMDELNVGEHMTVNGLLSCEGGLNVVGDVNVSGYTECNSCNITDECNVIGILTTGSLVCKDGAEIEGLLSVSDKVECKNLSTDVIEVKTLETDICSVSGTLQAENLVCKASLQTATLDVSGETGFTGELNALTSMNVANVLKCARIEVSEHANIGGSLECVELEVDSLRTPTLEADNMIVDELHCNKLSIVEELSVPLIKGFDNIHVAKGLQVDGLTLSATDVVISSSDSSTVVSVEGRLVTRDLTVTGILEFDDLVATNLTVTGETKVFNDIIVKNGIVGEQATVRASILECVESLTTNTALISGALEVKGGLSVSGPIKTRYLEASDSVTTGSVRCSTDVTCVELVTDSLTVSGALSVDGQALFRNDVTILGGMTVMEGLSNDVSITATDISCSGLLTCDILDVRNNINTPLISSPGALTISSDSTLTVTCGGGEALRVTPSGIYTDDVFLDGASVRELIEGICDREFVVDTVNKVIRDAGVSVSALSGRFADMSDSVNLLNIAEFDKHMTRVEDQLVTLNSLLQNSMGCTVLEGMIKQGDEMPTYTFSSGESLTLYDGNPKTFYVVET